MEIEFSDIIEDTILSVENQSKKLVKTNSHPPSVILHPEVLGRVIAFHSFQNLVDSPLQIQAKPNWDENLQLYDDPLRTDGYGSCLFDDEGSLTQARQLIEDGYHTAGLFDLMNSDWKVGGNGFRTSWYQPMLRSYQFPLIRNITNLVIVGGNGKGKHFTDRSGTSLVILRGHGFTGGRPENPQFIIHANETELWKDGTFLGPSYNVTVRGSIDELMKQGDLSADQYPVVDDAVSGAVYIGYMHAPSGLIRLS
jgi:predicted Zn-dependent protease